MDNCGGGGLRLPPDGDEFPAAYHEFILSPNQQQQQTYQYITKRAAMAINGDGESVVDGYMPKNFNGKMSPKKIEIAGYYPKDSASSGEASLASLENNDHPPPPLPLTGPPKLASSPTSNDNWRQDNKSERSVKDKIAMFSSQSSVEAPLFPTSMLGPSAPRRLAKHKSSDDVFADDSKQQPAVAAPERTQSYFDLSPDAAPSSPTYSPSYLQKSTNNLSSPAKSTSVLNAFPVAHSAGCTNQGLTRATSFSGSCGLFANGLQQQTPAETAAQLARTNSLASTFKRPTSLGEDARKSSLNQLIEQRRKGFSKLRGLVIPEKDAMPPVDQPIIDLPEIKSRDSILNNQASRTNIQDKWGSQSSLASNTSTVSSSVRTNGTSFKMPAPKILSNYSPAFKRKSFSVYNSSSNGTAINQTTTTTTTPVLSNSKQPMSNGKQQQQQTLSSPASDAPKSLESICSPTRSDYSFDFVPSSTSPDNQSNNNNISNNKPNNNNNNKLNGQRKLGRNEYDDSDNDSAVSSSQSSISRGFSPPMSPVPSDRSTISSERSYLSSETNSQRSPQLILEKSDKASPYSQARLNFLAERSISSPASKTQSQIPQRQAVKRSNSSIDQAAAAAAAAAAEAAAESLRVLKPQSVEAINRKNILASARCRSGRDLNGSPLIQRKFSDEEESPTASGEFVSAANGEMTASNAGKPEIKIAYIEITQPSVEELLEERKPALPPKRSVIPQAKSLPIPSTRQPKVESQLEVSNDMKSWVRTEMRSLSSSSSNGTSSYEPRKKPLPCDTETTSFNGARNFSGSGEVEVDLIDSIKPKPRTSVPPKKSSENDDLLTVLSTKTRSRSAIHVEETSYGKLKSQMSLEDILSVKSSSSLDSPTKLPRSQSVVSEGKSPTSSIERPRRSNSTDLWAEEKSYASKMPSLGKSSDKEPMGLEETLIETSEHMKSKIPMPRNLGRRSASVTDMKKVFEKADVSTSSSGTSSPGGQSGNVPTHNRFPSLDSSIEESIVRPDERIGTGEQFGSISSLASSTSLISQQELAQLVEEANLEEPRGGHDVVVVLLHKENPSGSVGIILAGGVDCESKEITIHRVLSHSIADKEGSVQRGDRILSINGRSMRGLTHRESLAVLKQPRSEVVLVVSRAKYDDNNGLPTSAKLRTRAESVETIVEGYENTTSESTAWGPSLTVTLCKDGAGLGFSLEGGRDSPLGDRPLLIKKIFTGGAAEKTGALRAGDQLLEVNKQDVSRMSRIEAWSLMKKLPDGEVNLLVRHPATKSS